MPDLDVRSKKMITAISTPEDVKAFLQEPLQGDDENWLAEQVFKNLDKMIQLVPVDTRGEIYAVGVGVDPGASYAYGSLNTENAWSSGKAVPPAPELTGRFVPSTWTALAEAAFLLGEANADNEEERLVGWSERFEERYPIESNIEPHLGCWRIVIHGVSAFRQSQAGEELAKVPIIASDFFYSEHCAICTELMNSGGQSAPYLAELAEGVAM